MAEKDHYNNYPRNRQKQNSFYKNMLTIYGRRPVLEALQDDSLEIYRLHLSLANKPSDQLERIRSIAVHRGIETVYHEKTKLSRISKNARQDQGVALDIVMKNRITPEDFCKESFYRVIALDGITNPQNLGMIIRSCAAGNIDALILPRRGNASISPLDIKASAGTLFKLPIIECDSLPRTLRFFVDTGAKLYFLDADASQSYAQTEYHNKTVFVLGNESNGISSEVISIDGISISIPMRRDIESLNVAVTAALLAFMPVRR